MFVSWRRLSLMHESGKVQQGLRGWPRKDDSKDDSMFWFDCFAILRHGGKSPLDFEEDGIPRKASSLAVGMALVRSPSIRLVEGVRGPCIAAIYFSSYVPKLKAKTEVADPPVNHLEEGRSRMPLETPSATPKNGTHCRLKSNHKALKGPRPRRHESHR